MRKIRSIIVLASLYVLFQGFAANAKTPYTEWPFTKDVNGITWGYGLLSNGGAYILGGYSEMAYISGAWSSPILLSGAITIPSALGEYSVTRIGNGAFEGCSGITSVTIPDCLKEIGRYAFYNCGFKSIVIPSSVVSIEDHAFSSCSLASVSIPSGVRFISDYVFSDCSVLTSVTMPNDITSIGSYAFSGCSRLSSVTIPSMVSSIGAGAFSNCRNMESVNISSLGAWCRISFGSSDANPLYYARSLYLNGVLVSGLTIPDNVTSVAAYAFNGCSGLTSVTIPDGVTDIGGAAFSDCSSLKSVTIGNGITNIRNSTFSGCESITTVAIPQCVCNSELSEVFQSAYDSITKIVISDGVVNIGVNAFRGCVALANITIPNSVTNVGYSAFSDCGGLKVVTIPQCICEKRMSSVFPSAYDEISEVVIAAGVTNIADYAFSGCGKLASVTIPNSVTSIGQGAFNGTPFYDNQPDGIVMFGNIVYAMKGNCPATIMIPIRAVNIAGGAFKNCSSLKSVTISDSVTSIGDSAFYGCSGLTNVTFMGNAPAIGKDCFHGVKTSCTVYVDKNSTGWNVAIPGMWNGVRIEYAPTMHTVTFETSGGFLDEASSNKYMTLGSKVGVLPIPTRYGHTFLGWWTSPSGGTQVLEDTVVTEDVTYYAQWEKVQTPTYIIENGVLTGVLDWNDCDSAIVPDGVTSIGSFAFRNCKNLVSVTIPNSVTNIGYGAFYYCSGLASVDIGKNVTSIEPYAFSGCQSITGIILPTNVKNIGDGAFYQCKNLESVNIPDGVEEIADSVFFECDLTSVTMPNSIKSIGRSSFSHCRRLNSLRIPNSVTNIGSAAFSYCSNLRNVTIPDVVTSIGGKAFLETPFYEKQPNGLVVFGSIAYAIKGTCPAAVAIPEGVVSISESAFSGCGELTSVAIPSSVKEIGTYAFQNCSGLVSIVIPNGVARIGSGAFSGCTGLANVAIPNSVTGIGRDAFNRTPFYSNLPDGLVVLGRVVYKHKGVCPSTVTIPNGVVSIGEEAFYCCSSLISVTIPSSVLSIGQRAFGCCDGLINITIPDSVTSIEHLAFDRCNNLANITIGSGVASIAYDAFSECGGRASFSVASENGAYKSHSGLLLSKDGTTLVLGVNGDVTIPSYVTSIGEGAFKDCSGLTSVTIPNSVVCIGYDAFYGCDNVMAVNISDLSAWCGISFADNAANPLSFGHKLYLNGSLISDLVIPDGVVTIGDYAFYGCNGITNVTIPNSVVNIGFNVFGGCEGLVSICCVDGNPSYKSDAGLLLSKDGTTLVLGVNGDVAIPSRVTSIGNNAFRDCIGLTSVLIPDSVTNIGMYAFYECSGLANVTIGDGVTIIGEGAFGKCGRLTSVTIPESVMRIGNYAFEDCKSLKKVLFDGNAPLVSYSTFSSVASGCTAYVRRSSTGWPVVVPGEWGKLKIAYFNEVVFNANGGNVEGDDKRYLLDGSAVGTLPMPTWTGYSFVGWFTAVSGGKQVSTATTVSADTIYYAHWEPNPITWLYKVVGGKAIITKCSSPIGDIVVPSEIGGYSVSKIAANVFANCAELISVTIPDGVTSIENSAFVGCSGLTCVTMPDSVTSIGDYAFYGCRSLVSVTMPDGVTSIGSSAFLGCSGLTSVTIPDGVTSIGFWAFYECSGLVCVTIPDSVTSIGDGAFLGCRSLASVTIPDSVTNIGEDAFYGCSGLTNVTFMGNAPVVGYSSFDSVASGCVALVSPKSTGWGVGVGEKWNGLTLQYWPEVLTEATSNAEVGEIVATFADKALAEQVASIYEYDAFRSWISNNNLYQPAVVANTNAAAAYLLGAERLFENAPKIEFEEVSVVDGEDGGLGINCPTMTLSVTVKDGEEAVKCAAEKVKSLFKATSDLGDWDGAAKLEPEVSIEATDDPTTMRFKVTPGDGASPRAFLQIRR